MHRCSMEYGVGSLVTPSHMALDLGLLEDDMTQYNQDYWFDEFDDESIGKHCAGKRTLPMTTLKFDEMMEQKVSKLTLSFGILSTLSMK